MQDPLFIILCPCYSVFNEVSCNLYEDACNNILVPASNVIPNVHVNIEDLT